MNKRQHKKAFKKLIAEMENVLTVLGEHPRKKTVRLSARERRVAETILKAQERQREEEERKVEDSKIKAAFDDGLGNQR